MVIMGHLRLGLLTWPSKTVARSGARSSRSKTGSRGGSRHARPSAPRRKPAGHRNPSRISAAGATVGRGVRAGWLMLAKGAGSTARSVGRARDLEPGHRRDGIALALLGVAVVIAASSWFDAARPVGQWIDTLLRVLIGSAVVLLPIALAAIAVVLMRTEPDPEARPRLILGAAMIALPALGLWHLWAGSPQDPTASPARLRVRRFRDRRTAVGRADGVDRRAVAVHRRALRRIARDRDDDPRGAVDGTEDVLDPRIPRRVLRRGLRGASRRRGTRGLLGWLLRRPGWVWRRGAVANRHAVRQLSDRRRGADHSGADHPDPKEEGRQAADAVTGPGRRRPVHAAVAGPADRRRSAEAAQRRPTTAWPRRSPRCCSSSRSTPP